eukprot:scaffold17800_cov60-Phaeocystis_antarctica.AAC.2
MPFGPSPHTPGAELVRGKSRPDPKESAAEHGRRKPSHRAAVRPAPEDGHAPPTRDGHAPRRRPSSRRAPSPTCLLCIVIVLCGLAKLVPSVLHSHPSPSPDADGTLRTAPADRQTDRPIASVAATAKPKPRSSEAAAPVAAAARGGDAPMAVPASLPASRDSRDRPEQPASRPRVNGSPGTPQGGKLSCISFQTELCPPLNLSLQTTEQQSQTHRRCAPLVKAEQTKLAPDA